MSMKEICKYKLSWNENLEGDLLVKWQTLVDDMAKGQPMELPRCYFVGVGGSQRYRLCGVCDASTVEYAAVTSLVEGGEDFKHSSSSFIVAKTRVAPLQTQTIPRLELLSALLWPDL